MAWRSVMITRPAYLRYSQHNMVVRQDSEDISIPLEDVSVLVLESTQITISGQLLSACAKYKIAVITVGDEHLPNGVLLPHEPHSRMLKILKSQLGLSKPKRKRLWQTLVKQKIQNQAAVLAKFSSAELSKRLLSLSGKVVSGDIGNLEAQASQIYFPALFGKHFSRKQERFHNAVLNYGYAIIRASLARNLVCHGLQTALGLHHHNELNQFNLADDLIEPYRPLLDDYILESFPGDPPDDLTSTHKAKVLEFLHQDITMLSHDKVWSKSSLLAAAEAIVISLIQSIQIGEDRLHLPYLAAA